jgi:hypothetical protein
MFETSLVERTTILTLTQNNTIAIIFIVSEQ